MTNKSLPRDQFATLASSRNPLANFENSDYRIGALAKGQGSTFELTKFRAFETPSWFDPPSYVITGSV